MPQPEIIKHQCVMDVHEQMGNHVHWSQSKAEGEVVSSVLYVQAVEMWDAMGQPEEISVTVEVGDILNPPRNAGSQLKLVEGPQ